MKVLVIGANGKVGEIVVDLLLKSDLEPKAMVRKKDQQTKFERKESDVVLADLEEDISHAYEGVDAVVFTAGSGGNTGKDKTELVDRNGAIKAIDEAVKHKVKKFVMVSAMGADYDPSEWPEEMSHYYQAKAAADRYLMQTDLDYTILKPGKLTDDVGTNEIEISDRIKNEEDSIPRMDVAETIAKILELNVASRKSYELLSGDTPIEKALSQLD